MKCFTIQSMPRWKIYLYNLYPPFLGAGIRITKIGPNFDYIKVVLKRRWWNRNIIGSAFGGSMYMMCDPFHMVLLMQKLGPRYVVRDKGADITFLKKGITDIHATFSVTDDDIAMIEQKQAEVFEKKFRIELKNTSDEIVAVVIKNIHIRRLK